MSKLKLFIKKAYFFTGTKKFFWVVIGLFCIESLWIALSNRYPMAFDENFHLGIIRLYAENVSPFWASQPENADSFGAVFRDPSYAYHYLMSFPYRLLALLTDNQTIQVIILRLMNIMFFATGLFVFRKVMKIMGSTERLSNIILLLFILIPVVPLLAGQINYDNVFFPVIAILLLWTISFSKELFTTRRLNSYLFSKIILLCMAASLLKFAFLPFFLATVILIGTILILKLKSPKRIWLSFLFGFSLVSRNIRYVMAILLIVSTGLFFERYGINMIKYQSPVPDCAKVMSVERCDAYGPWSRDNYLAKHKDAADTNFGYYAYSWFYGMWMRLFFTVDGPTNSYMTRGPLLLPSLAAALAAAMSLLVSIGYGRRVIKQYGIVVLVPFLLGIFYVFILFIDGYEGYLRTGKPVAINGRYLLPVLIPLMLFSAYAWRNVKLLSSTAKRLLLILLLICLLSGGGALTFILRSNEEWYWDNGAVRAANSTIKNAIGPIIPGYSNPILFLR